MEQDVKRNWRDARIKSSVDNNFDEIFNGRRHTALENLSRRYKRFSTIALVFVLWGPMTFSNPSLLEHGRMVMSIVSAVYFMICSGMDYWLYQGIRSIDCSTMTVSEVSRRALSYRKRHLQFIAILLPIAFIWIGMLVYYINYNKYFIWGIVIGGIIGFAVGFRQLLAFLSDYRRVVEDNF